MNVLPYIAQSNNKTDGVIITFIDITLRIKDLKEQEKFIAEHELLLDTIAHDIKNPLTSLSLTIKLLKKVPVNGVPKLPQLLRTLESSMIKDIISDLAQNRWQGQPYQALEELLDLQNIVEDIRLTLSGQLQDSKAVLKVQMGKSEVTFARRKLRSILYNLISKAIKHKSSERVPHILIKSMEQDGSWLYMFQIMVLALTSKTNKAYLKNISEKPLKLREMA